MRSFDYDKVKKLAIDLPNHQQIYVFDHKHRDSVLAI